MTLGEVIATKRPFRRKGWENFIPEWSHSNTSPIRVEWDTGVRYLYQHDLDANDWETVEDPAEILKKQLELTDELAAVLKKHPAWKASVNELQSWEIQALSILEKYNRLKGK